MKADPDTLLIADLHLEPGRPEITAQFERFLAGPVRRAQRLFILGDLFEAWLGDDAAGPFEAHVAGLLGEASAAGPDIAFMAGNRDFLLGPDWCRQAGIRQIEEPEIIQLAGEPTLLLHGDILCTDDVEYQRLRRRVRDPDWQQRMLSRPRWMRRLAARGLRAASRLRNRGKPPEIMDVTAEAVARAFREHGVTRMIHGHTHRPAIHRLDVDGHECTRYVLGDWYEQGSVLEAGPEGLALKSLSRHPGPLPSGNLP